MSTVNIKNILLKIMEHCNDVLSDTENFDYQSFRGDHKTQRAVFMSLHQVGELSGRRPKQFCHKHVNIPWAGIKQMRNIISHEYVKIDLEIVWNTVSGDIPSFLETIKKIVDEMNNGNEESVFEKD